MTTAMNIDARPLKVLTAAAVKARDALGLIYLPVVVRDEAAAFRLATATRARALAVMLGDGAFWVVCLADATRLERAGYEWAPRA